MCTMHNHLGRYLEGQGHNMTVMQNRVRPITSLLEVGLKNYFTKIITVLRQIFTRKIITTMTEMITILR